MDAIMGKKREDEYAPWLDEHVQKRRAHNDDRKVMNWRKKYSCIFLSLIQSKILPKYIYWHILYSVFANHFKMFCLNFRAKIFHYLSKYFLFCYENIWIFHAKNDIRLCFHQYFNVLVNYVVSSFCTSQLPSH